MKNILIYSDIHICLSSIEECELIFNEIVELCNIYSIDTIISLGDNFDCNKPSALELNCLGNFVKKLGDKKIILLSAQSHESETLELSSVDIYGILKDTITVVKEYQDDYLYCGHLIVKEAKKNFGATISKEQFKKFKYVFLGHQHRYEIIKPNICQLGSVRFVNFDEAEDKQKIVALIEDYKGEKEKVHFIALKSPIPMIDIILNSNKDNKLEEKAPKNNPKEALQGTILAQNTDKGKDTETSESPQIAPTNPSNPRQFNEVCQLTSFLDKLPEKTKIRIIFKDYQNWVNFLPYYQKYKEKFNTFKDKKDFIMDNNLVIEKKDSLSLKESLIRWMEQNKIDEKIKSILLEELK